MKKVFLINPLVQVRRNEYIRFLRDYAGGEIPTSMIYPPLDLAYIAATLRNNNISVILLDASSLNITNSASVKIVTNQKPDFVGIISAWGSIPSDLELAKDLKTKSGSIKIVFAGPPVTVNPSIALSSGYVDYVILGEPEKPFLEIVEGTFNENIAYKFNGKDVISGRSLLKDLDQLPFPARDLLPNGKYVAPYVRRNPFTTISTSRGCPYSKCNFCPSNIWYMGQVRYRSVENVMEEIDEIVKRFKIHSIIFRDQSLTFEQERLYRLCDKILQKNYPLYWRCFSGVKNLNKDLLKLMKKAGCYQINYGFESGSQEILDLNNKGTTLEESIAAARLTKAAGIEVSGSFMLGMWGDTEETIKKTINLAVNLDLDFAEFLLATPLPATKFYEQCGLPKETNAQSIQRWYNRSYSSNLLLGNDFLKNQLKKAYKSFYFRPSYISKRIHNTTSLKNLSLQLKSAVSLFKSTHNL